MNLLTLCRAILFCAGFGFVACGQDLEDKRPLNHSDYDLWNTIRQRSISNDGNWIMYSVVDGKNRSTLRIRQNGGSKEYAIKNASSGRFTFDSSMAVYVVRPDADLVKKLRKEKKTSEIPDSKLQILDLKSGEPRTISGVSSYSLPRENSEWITFRPKAETADKSVEKGSAAATETYEVTPEGLKRNQKSKSDGTGSDQQKTAPKKEAPKKSKKKKAAGQNLVLHNLKSGLERRFPFVTSSAFSKKAERLAFATSTKEGGAGDGVFVLDLKDEKAKQVSSGLGNYRSLTFSDDGTQLAFMSDRDDYEAEKPSWSVYLLRRARKEAERVAMAGDEGLPKDWWVASAPLGFSKNNQRLYFSTAPIPDEVKNPKKADDEPKAKLDLWHWKDKALQPQQLLQAAQERNRSYRAVYHLREKKLVQLATKQVPSVAIDGESDAEMLLGTADDKYRYMRSWDISARTDVYLVNQKTGETKLVAEALRARPQVSPSGRYIMWFDADKRAYFAMTPDDTTPVNVTKGVKTRWDNELHDTPSPPRSYGAAGWLKDEAGVLVYDRFDIWQLDPTGKDKPVRLTNGRQARLRHRYARLDSEQRTIDPTKPMMLTLFDEGTKASGFGSLSIGVEEPVTKLIMLDEALGGLAKARNSDAVVFTRSTFRRCPDIWSSTTAFKKIARVSRVNAQQSEYLWGNAELVHWKAKDGKPLDGILCKPDGFDPNKKYPMMVYYYERNSDNLHRYTAPAAGRSIINFSFYVSRGYVLFIPDIPYTTGFPGDSAVNAIVPGVESIVDQGFIDEKRIGMQGHSWGGYQAAYLVTKTDMFACAESGAPVSNMTSAYGGIRWGSGMSRMFQYEQTQSRIGETLWEGRDKYIANSPVFFADKINTPLLILHNDQDTAVPWYQGIELFVAMRRLQKPVWMMNYNGEPHWVMKEENRRDFATRMQQFFDHYLQGAPEPEWMANGIPAVDKGKKFGLEPAAKTVEPKEEPAAGK